LSLTVDIGIRELRIIEYGVQALHRAVFCPVLPHDPSSNVHNP